MSTVAYDETTAVKAVEPAPAAAGPVIANPGALGLFAFALTTFLLSMVNANFVNKGVAPMVVAVALTTGGIAQLLAGMWEFRCGNTFGATAFTMYGGFWLSYWALVQFFAKDIPVKEVGNAVGLWLIAWGLLTALFFIASFKTNRAINVVFAVLFITFMLLGIGNAGSHTTMIHWGGYFGLITAACAAYTGLAVVTNETFDRTILPVKPL
jgi:succinate-acetate transporter protein